MHRSLRRASLLLTLLVVLVAPQTAHAADTYTDPQNRFSLLVLDGFQQVSRENAPKPIVIGFTTADTPLTGYNVIVEDITPDIGTAGTLDEAVAALVETDRRLPGFQPFPYGVRPTMLGGREARGYEFIATPFGSDPVYFVQVLTLWQGSIHCTLTLNVRADQAAALMPQFRAVIDSFAFPGGAVVPDPEARPS